MLSYICCLYASKYANIHPISILANKGKSICVYIKDRFVNNDLRLLVVEYILGLLIKGVNSKNMKIGHITLIY